MNDSRSAARCGTQPQDGGATSDDRAGPRVPDTPAPTRSAPAPDPCSRQRPPSERTAEAQAYCGPAHGERWVVDLQDPTCAVVMTDLAVC